MHPELHLVVHRQQERELEQRLARELVRRERAASGSPVVASPWWVVLTERLRARTAVPARAAGPVCCAAL